TYNNLREWIMTDEDMSLHSDESCRQFVHEHDLIVSALEMRDGDMADRVMRLHLRRARDLLLEGKGRAAAPANRELPAA
nr:FCD domain-containing protein [Burkholderiales bacterium]